jgi:sugar/nucleoside kinase (ribokinase family)
VGPAGLAGPPGRVPNCLLAEARRVLERRQPPSRSRVRHGRPPANGGEDGGGADEPAEEERLQPVAPLVSVHATILGVILCALGDLMLDLIVRIERPLARGDDTPAVTRAGAGGQAANVAAWAAGLGAQSRLIAKWGGDTSGKLVAAEVGARRVEMLGPMAPGRNGVVVSIVEPGGERSMLSDRGVATELSPEDIQPEWLAGCDVLYVSGYSLLRQPIDAAAISAARAVREQGGLVAVDLSTWSTMREFGVERFACRVAELEPAVIFATERELEELGDAATAETIVIKRGPAGAVVRTAARATVHEARPVDVVDSTGAGDALAAGFLVGGIELGLDAAARCISKLGTMP